MTVDFRSLQERLRQRLLAQIAAGELTGLQLARQTGFQQAHISNFLNRKRGLSLEAMDAILRARKLSLESLLAEARRPSPRRRSLQANASGVTWIPIVAPENCHANELPYGEARNALEVMTVRLEKLRSRTRQSRRHWERFVAMRVGTADAEAMMPRLERGAIAVVDRHSNDPDGESIYLVQAGKKIVLRYVEQVAGRFVLRPENAAAELIALEAVRDPLAAVIGRVCLVMAEV